MPEPAAATVYDPEDLLRQLQATRGHFALESGFHGDLRLDLDRALGSPHVLAPAIGEPSTPAPPPAPTYAAGARPSSPPLHSSRSAVAPTTSAATQTSP